MRVWGFGLRLIVFGLDRAEPFEPLLRSTWSIESGPKFGGIHVEAGRVPGGSWDIARIISKNFLSALADSSSTAMSTLAY